jgi:hypothetical protein
MPRTHSIYSREEEYPTEFSDEKPCCRYCTLNWGQKVEAIALAPQRKSNAETGVPGVSDYTWRLVCATHLSDWYDGCPDGMPRPIALKP